MKLERLKEISSNKSNIKMNSVCVHFYMINPAVAFKSHYKIELITAKKYYSRKKQHDKNG